MLLQRLRELELRSAGDAPPPGYGPVRVQWALRLTKKGEFSNLEQLTGEGKQGERGKLLGAPTAVRTVAIKPLLFCDKAEYVFGIPKSEDKAAIARASACHAAFVSAVERCAETTKSAEVKAAAKFLSSRKPGSRQHLPKALEAGDVVIIDVGTQRLTDLPEVQAHWSGEMRAASDADHMTCLVCGEHRQVERTLQVKIKGIPGGQTSGTSLISANEPAFLSYGLEQSLISPICADCAESSHRALNKLLAGEKTRLRIGDALVWVFWTRSAEDVSFYLDDLADPKPENVRALLASPFKGKDASRTVDGDDFCALALSASGGRAVVRGYVETSLSEAVANLRAWFELQQLAGSDEDPPAYGVKNFCRSLTHDLNKEMNPEVPQALVRTAMNGTPLPQSLLHLIVRRNRAEQRVTRPRAMLAKMVLTSNPRFGFAKEDLNDMDPDNKDPGYVCGRLFYELEEAQRAALPGINATIRDRYFGTASSAPASVFAGLLRGSLAHLSKLQRDKPAAAAAIEARIEAIAGLLPEFPRTLKLPQQALFSLGYYHQRAANRAAMRERLDRKNAKEE
jgi:CRISPR-associated protein Csd1